MSTSNGQDNSNKKERSSFSGRLGFVLSAAGASVGLGNIWRFPYLAAKYGGGIFLLVYIILALTFGYSMIMAETAIGRMTKKSPVGAFGFFGHRFTLKLGGWINAVVPMLIVPYYSTIGGWVVKYMVGYFTGQTQAMAQDGYFSDFISNGLQTELFFLVFAGAVMVIIYLGVRNGIERVGAMQGVKYLLIPNFANFSWMTVVSAMEQMFFSLSIAMGILITFGSYMKDDVSVENATEQVEIFDTGIAFMAALMVIPAVFAFSGGNPETLGAGPSLMFITIPKVFASLDFGTPVGIMFFVLVFFAALTSAIALAESAVSTFEDELHLGRIPAATLMAVIMLVIGTLSSLGYGPLAGVTLIGMQFLDFFDFITNSLMMPLGALATCLLVTRVIGFKRIEEEVELDGMPFKRKRVFNFMIRWLCPIFIIIILITSVLTVLGIVSV